MQTTHRITTIPAVESGHKRSTVFLALLAAVPVTIVIVIAITMATATDGSRRPAAVADEATSSVTPVYGPGSNSLSLVDPPPAASPWVTSKNGPGSNSLSLSSPSA